MGVAVAQAAAMASLITMESKETNDLFSEHVQRCYSSPEVAKAQDEPSERLKEPETLADKIKLIWSKI